jgi:DNA-directed RNA polymerase alpha subunit
MNDAEPIEAPDILDQSIAVLELPARVHNALIADNHLTVRQLVARCAIYLQRAPNIGKVSLSLVRTALAEHGLYLKGEGPPPPAPRLPVFASLTISHRLRIIEAKLDIVVSVLSKLMPP